jgi:hypothetical protein
LRPERRSKALVRVLYYQSNNHGPFLSCDAVQHSRKRPSADRNPPRHRLLRLFEREG